MYSETQYLQMPSGLNNVAIHITTDKENDIDLKNSPFINIYIYDTNDQLRVQALYRGEQLICEIGEQKASEGCFKGNIQAGTWKAVIVSEKEYAPIKITFNPFREEVKQLQQPLKQEEQSVKSVSKWYGGDFHTHTRLSDGSLRLDEVSEVMQKNVLDFVFLTDHNMYPSELDEKKGIFKGMELTLASGHMNIHGVEREGILKEAKNLKYFIEKVENSKGCLEEIIMAIKGCNRSINHPFMAPWAYQYEKLPLSTIQTIEVICDPTWKTATKANEKALRFWYFLNRHGHYIVGIGGSDSHLPYGECYEWAKTPSWYGDPTTYVWTQACKLNDIIEGVHQGRVYVSRGPKLEMSINKGKYLPGDNIAEKQLEYKVKAFHCAEKIYVDLVICKKTCLKKERKVLLVEQDICFEMDLEEEDEWISLELRNEEEALIGFVNPIYRKRKMPQFVTWGEAVKAFEAEEDKAND